MRANLQSQLNSPIQATKTNKRSADDDVGSLAQTHCANEFTYSMKSIKTRPTPTDSVFRLRFHFIKSQRTIIIVKSTSNRISSRGHIDTERSCMAYSHAMPLCLCGPIGDTTGVSIWQAFNQSTMAASYKHWINIDAFHFHSQHSTATIRKQTLRDSVEFTNAKSPTTIFSLERVIFRSTL